MSDLEHARQMLGFARRDFKALTGMKDEETFAEEIFGFFAQQAVEKALKAWLSAIGVEYPKVHDLKGLAQVLKKQHEAIPEELSSLLDLSDFAVQLRYDSYDAMGSGLDRETIIKKVSGLIETVEAKLSTIKE
jgi:HEPN domain-containing protein